MKKFVTLVVAVTAVLTISNCKKKDEGVNYMKELGCCTWTETSAGNTFEYTFTKEFFTTVANGQKWGDFTISKIDDEKRMFVIYAKMSKKYKDVWWQVVDDSSVQISKMVGGKYYDSLDDAMAAERTGKWMTLKKK